MTMTKQKSLNREYNAHLKKFPLPKFKHFELEYSGIPIPLRDGHFPLCYFFLQNLQPTLWGWESRCIPLTEIDEDYASIDSLRTALKRLNSKFKAYRKAKLYMTLKGNGSSAFSLRLEYGT